MLSLEIRPPYATDRPPVVVIATGGIPPTIFPNFYFLFQQPSDHGVTYWEWPPMNSPHGAHALLENGGRRSHLLCPDKDDQVAQLLSPETGMGKWNISLFSGRELSIKLENKVSLLH